MTDIVDKNTRSKMMANIKSVSHLEMIVNKKLWGKGVRARRNVKDLFGKPDWAIKKYKVVIFLDSCFWHACPIHGNLPKNNKEFWESKLRRNVERDIEVTKYYQDREWKILRVWEHEVKGDIEKAVNKIIKFINDAKKLNLK
ncbi:very short patch repair endonuclease [Cytobacillus oceanisediminis]|uniref:Very short patch repair endonuclease n=1 Tax=Cytobacillus oceanisediminis TaxID=665099 RepID=A0ABX3CYW0_9BACI|nr:very short patch repair endonuclease [Cytobacillus oceanisediminis]OHX50686.1 very short patch repair endonuclease [Cytobacillus oceanisediminis]